MQVLNIVDQPTGQVVLDLVNDDGGADVDQLNIGVLLLVIIDGLINLLVVADALAEVESGQLGVLPLVIRRGGLDFEDIGHDEILVIADRLDEEGLDIGIATLLVYPLATLLGGVCRVEDGDNAFLRVIVEPIDHIGDGHLGGGSAHALAFFIVGVEEGGLGLGGVAAAIGSDVEDFGGDADPGEIPHC